VSDSADQVSALMTTTEAILSVVSQHIDEYLVKTFLDISAPLSPMDLHQTTNVPRITMPTVDAVL